MPGGLPDLSEPHANERFTKLSTLFASEQADFEKQKSELISSGRANGKSAEEILNDMVGLYDSQSDFYKTSLGWSGDIFAVNSSSPEGLARTLQYVTDLSADIRVKHIYHHSLGPLDITLSAIK